MCWLAEDSMCLQDASVSDPDIVSLLICIELLVTRMACARITSSCCQGPWMFIQYLQPPHKTQKLVFWEDKRSPVFFCVFQLVN